MKWASATLRAVGITPAPEAKAESTRELGYRVAGMVGVNLTVPRPMVKAKAHRPGHRAGRADHEDVDVISRGQVMDDRTRAEVEAEHAVETYKSLISISTEGFKALQLLNGGAVLAVLTYLGQRHTTGPDVLRAALPMGLFVAGLAAGTLVYATSYLTQFALHNENMKRYKVGKHKKWLWLSFILCLASLALFSFGAFACLDALGRP